MLGSNAFDETASLFFLKHAGKTEFFCKIMFQRIPSSKPNN